MAHDGSVGSVHGRLGLGWYHCERNLQKRRPAVTHLLTAEPGRTSQSCPCRGEAGLTLCEVMGLVLPKSDSKRAMQRIRGRWVEEHGLTGTLWEATEVILSVQP